MGNWAEKIKLYRFQRRLTQKALARELSVNQASISQWENGRAEPSKAMKRRLQLSLGATDSERVLAALRNSVRTSAEHCILLEMRDEDPILDAYSLSIKQQLGLIVPGDVGKPLTAISGASQEHNWAQLIEHGLLTDAQPTLRVHYAATRFGQTFLGLMTHTPFHCEDRIWLRSVLEVLSPAQAAKSFADSPRVLRLADLDSAVT